MLHPARTLLVVLLTGCILCATATAALANEEGGDSSDYRDELAQTFDHDNPRYRADRIGPSRYVDHRWYFNAEPYLWSPGLWGNVDIADRTGDLSSSPIDAIENRDLGAGISFEVGYLKRGLLVDLFYLNAATEGVEITGSDDAFDLDLFVAQTALTWGYEVFDGLELGPIAGFRYLNATTGLATENDEQIGAAADRAWFDGILGLRGRFDVFDPLFIPFYADIGGLGFTSDLTWQAFGGVGVGIKRLDLELGYRHLYFDADFDDFNYEAHIGGPLLRAAFRW